MPDFWCLCEAICGAIFVVDKQIREFVRTDELLEAKKATSLLYLGLGPCFVHIGIQRFLSRQY